MAVWLERTKLTPVCFSEGRVDESVYPEGKNSWFSTPSLSSQRPPLIKVYWGFSFGHLTGYSIGTRQATERV